MKKINDYIEYKGKHINNKLYQSMLKYYKRRCGLFRGLFTRKLKDEYFEYECIELKDALIDNLDFFSLFKNLKYIELVNCEIANPLTNYRFDNLTSLDITSDVGGDLHIDDWILNCKNINYLFIQGYENVYGFEKISKCNELGELYIVNCKNINTKSLSECKKLNWVVLVNEHQELFNYYGVDYFQFLKELPLLKKIRIEGHNLDNGIADILKECTSLEEIEINYDSEDYKYKLDISFIENMPNLKEISLDYVYVCNSDILYQNKSVERISFYECDGLGNLSRFADMQQLTSLNIWYYSQLTEELKEHYIEVISEKNDCNLSIS